MPTGSPSPLEAFRWEPQPDAQRLVQSFLDEFQTRLPAAAMLARRMAQETGTRFFDWVDYIALPAGSEMERRMQAVGYRSVDLGCDVRGFRHDAGMFPTLLLHPDGHLEVGIKVESIVDFAAAYQLPLKTNEPPLSRFRRLLIAEGSGTRLWAIERHGHRTFFAPPEEASRRLRWLGHLEAFRTRRRDFETDEGGFTHAAFLIDAAVSEIGAGLACDLFFAAEREYWQRRNRAARTQKSRQDALGLGWANHDHHTYRSSRPHFARVILMFEKLGFTCRERFYAGRQAGWGAQILEQADAGVVIFADVDLAPEEVINDFAHEPLAPLHSLGTVGLWCGLHGESFLQAGMHHLECQFDFNALRQQLEEQANVKMMKPFTDLPHLRQTFTEGETWPVKEDRLATLLRDHLIAPEQAQQIRQHGAIGSHLENLERNEGFKGFNQQGISEIIEATDPRKNLPSTG